MEREDCGLLFLSQISGGKECNVIIEASGLVIKITKHFLSE